MTSRFVPFVALGISGLACAAVLSISLVSDATGVNRNIAAWACGPSSLTSDGPRLLFVNGAVLNDSATDAHIACPLVTGPLDPAPSVTTIQYFIDGDQLSGSRTQCLVASFEYTGEFLGSNSAIATETNFDLNIALPDSNASDFSYAFIDCIVPPQGRIRGLTVFNQ